MVYIWMIKIIKIIKMVKMSFEYKCNTEALIETLDSQEKTSE